ncbi:MAG: hypothetical protein WBA55_02310 [Allopontixanthobacter sediminis]
MIDYFALGLAHLLIVVALIRMLGRDDLDRDAQPEDDTVAAPDKAR